MRLIDAEELKAELRYIYEHEKDVINSIWKLNTILDRVDEIPPAFDVDKVVEQLEKKKQTHKRCIKYEKKNGTITEEFQQRKAVEVLEDAIEIVKAGGVNENSDEKEM